MEKIKLSTNNNRRQFLKQSIGAGVTLCFGCSSFLSMAQAQESQPNKLFHDRISKNSGMSFEQVYNFAFKVPVIPILNIVAEKIGREKFVEMLIDASDKVWYQNIMLNQFYGNLPDDFMSNVYDLEVLEESEQHSVWKITNCLWAKTFRELESADIGYAMFCHGDYSYAKANNQKLERNTTLMQGDDYCFFKWTRKD